MTNSFTFDSTIIKELYYIKKDYSEIKDILKSYSDSRSFIILGKILLQEKNLDEAYNYFSKAKYDIGCAYCKFIDGNLNEALKIIENSNNDFVFLNWLKQLIYIIKQDRKVHPTYFQIRNFYEQDLGILFMYKKYDLIEKIINNSEYLANFNSEIYKYNARVLYDNGYTNKVEWLLKKSLNIYYNDPETHYLLGEYYLNSNNKKGAKEAYQKAIEVNDGYYPAEKKLKEL